MSRIVPGRKYSYAELQQLRNDPEIAQRALQGYVLRQDLDGTVRWVHHSKATGGGGNFGAPVEVTTRNYEAVWDKNEGPGPWDLPPIVKRTPQQRVDSLMLRFIGDCQKAGTVPGVSDARISEILGEAWKTGRNEITADIVRRVAQHFLGEAEAKHKETLSHKVADYRPS